MNHSHVCVSQQKRPSCGLCFAFVRSIVNVFARLHRVLSINEAFKCLRVMVGQSFETHHQMQTSLQIGLPGTNVPVERKLREQAATWQEMDDTSVWHAEASLPQLFPSIQISSHWANCRVEPLRTLCHIRAKGSAQ